MRAGTVILFDTAGGGEVGSVFGTALKAELAGQSMVRKARPKGWKSANVGAAAKVGDAARSAGADAAVDSVVLKGKNSGLQILAVTASGEVVFDKTIRLPKKKADAVVKGAAKDVALAVAERLGSASPARGPAPTAVQPAPVKPAPTKLELEEPPAQSAGTSSSTVGSSTMSASSSPPDAASAAAPSRRARSRSFHFAVRGGAGITSYSDSLSTNIDGGDLKIAMAPTLRVGGGIEMAYSQYFHLDIAVRRFASSMTHQSDQNVLVNSVAPTTIKTAVFGGTVLLASGLEFGPMAVCLTAGVSYDKLDASEQSLPNADGGTDVVVLVPSWTRLEALTGLTFYYGDLGTKGITAQVSLLVVPWGQVKETPLTSGASSSTLGVQGGLRLRYQLTDLLGGAGGLFVELEGNVDYARVQFKGDGTRKSLFKPEIPVQASKEARFGFGGGLNIGYML